MIKYKRSRTYREIVALCKAQKVPFDDRLYRSEGWDTIVVGCKGPHIHRPGQGYAIFNTFNGQFFGTTDKGVKFDSNSSEHDREPWKQALLAFFMTNDPSPEVSNDPTSGA